MPIFIVCEESFENVHQISIPFGFHFIIRNETQGCTVNAVPYTVGGFRVIFKDMSQVGIACPASHLNALHSMAVILDLHEGGSFDGLCKAGQPQLLSYLSVEENSGSPVTMST